MKNYAYLDKSFPARNGKAAVRLVPMASESWLLVNEISLTFPAVTILPNSALLGTAVNLLSKRTKVLDRERVAWLISTILLCILPTKNYMNQRVIRVWQRFESVKSMCENVEN